MNADLKNLLLEFTQENNQDDAFKKTFEQSVNGNYEDFVNQLKGWSNDPKVTNFLQSGLKDGILSEDKFSVSSISISCSVLIPTQNEIDLNKSLDYPLKDPNSAKVCIEGKDIMIGGAPIITFNGRYIIDGHHRWSQVYCMNPNAKMKALNFKKSGLGPGDMLKATQMAIAATSGKISVQTVEGSNLLKMNPLDIIKYVEENISEGTAKLLSNTKKQAAKIITLNAKQMQKNNQPVKGAPERGYMPQTDEPKGNLINVVKALTSGEIQVVEPFTKQIKTENKKLREGYLALYSNKEEKPPIDAINGLEIFISKLKSEKYNVFENYYYWEDFNLIRGLGRTVGVTVGSDNIYLKDIDTGRTATYGESLLASLVKSKRIYPPILMNKHLGINESKESKQMRKLLKEWDTSMSNDKEQDIYEEEELNELQSSAEIKKDELFDKVVNKLEQGGVTELNDLEIEEFIEYNYDMIAGVVETISPNLLVKNFVNYSNSNKIVGINESLKKVLKEDDSVDAADPIAMFQDFSNISGSLADIYSTLVGYQTSYVQNGKVKSAMSQIMNGVNQLMKQSTATMQMIGNSFGINEQIKRKINKK